jgi:hypothetical protein
MEPKIRRFENFPDREDDRVFLTETAENKYELSPCDPDFRQRMNVAEDIMRRYRDTLHVLAK